MEKRKVQDKKRYLLAFLIGTFIFILGFIITYSISYFEYQRISNIQRYVSYEIFEDKLKLTTFSEDLCSLTSFKEVSEDLGFQGAIIDDLENKLGKKDQRVLFQKKFYTLVELEHFEFVKEINNQCNLSIPIILFFYSNEEEDSEESEKAGRLLDLVARRNENLIIYSFDVNLDSELIEKLKQKYSIDKPPTIIINENIKLEGIKNIEEVTKHLNQTNTSTIYLN